MKKKTESKKSEFCENIIFLIALLMILIFGCASFIKEENLVSKTENRTLSTFKQFAFDDFLDGSFQNNFESALSDQFLFSENIRVGYSQAVSSLPTFGIKENICHGRYIELASDTERQRGTFNCEDYIVYLPESLTDEKREIVKQNIEKYNYVNQLTNAYYYFVDDPSSFDFENEEKVNDYYSLLKKELKGEKGLDELKYDNFNEYKGYFYKTDHHWDYRGSYQGFLDIAKILDISNPAEPSGVYTNHENFYGSYARATNNYDFKEEFVFYDFDIPKHKVLINGEVGEYSHFEDYKKHNYEYDRATNYYAEVYGDDFAEVVFDFDQLQKENLLIVSNSYSNAINELIAQYFDKTYVIDLRHYKEKFGKDFVLSEYLRTNKIDKTLILMSPTFIWTEESNRGLEL